MGHIRADHSSPPIRLLTDIFSPLFFWRRDVGDLSDLMMGPTDAIKELEKRRKDPELQRKINEYLKGDIPDYFSNGPILYLARHVGTPNFETLRFIYLMKHLGLKTVITQDSKGIFVSQNNVKRALCKLPICRSVTQKNSTLHEQYHNVTIVDFNKTDGKIFSEIETVWGEKLINFHQRLFRELELEEVEFPDDADWIDRHYRGNLLRHYKDLMALFLVHGIFFENYNPDEPQEVYFVRTILRPACEYVKEKFGYYPLIVQVFPTTFESTLFWMSYPSKVLDIIRKSMHPRHV